MLVHGETFYNNLENLEIMKKGENLMKKFEGADRESWPLPPSSVFKCREATPWVNPNLFQTVYSDAFTYSQYKAGVVIVGDTFPEVSLNHLISYNEDFYNELEHHSAQSNRLSTRIVEYSQNAERAIDIDIDIDPGSGSGNGPAMSTPNTVRMGSSSLSVSSSSGLTNDSSNNYYNGNTNNNRQSSRMSQDSSGNREEGFDGDVLVKFKELPDLQYSSSSSTTTGSRSDTGGGVGTNSDRGGGGGGIGRKKRKWIPFQKDQSQSWKLFY